MIFWGCTRERERLLNGVEIDHGDHFGMYNWAFSAFFEFQVFGQLFLSILHFTRITTVIINVCPFCRIQYFVV